MRTFRTVAGLLAITSTVGAWVGLPAVGAGSAYAQTATAPAHFDAKGNLPSTYTIELRKSISATLPFEDKRDFDEAKKGFIAEPPFTKIMADAGNVAWDMGSYQWLLQGKDFQSIHPSLQRQAILNMAYGLYEVRARQDLPSARLRPRQHQLHQGRYRLDRLRPADARETARAALAFINEKLGKRPVLGVVYSHSHVDHFGGVRGVVDEADVVSGKVKVIAPEGFMQAAIEENVFSGNAMSRRTQYSYAVLLPRDPYGHADQSIGKNVANGNVGLIAPNLLIRKDFEEVTIDGVKMVFQNTPDTEAPVEMNTYFPQFKAFWAAENITGTIHNIYTPRGAPGAQCAQLVEADQRRAVPVRPGSRGDVRLAQLAALGQCAHPGGAAHAARYLRQPEQPDAALRQPRA